MPFKLDYSALKPNAIDGPGDYVIAYGIEPDHVFTANVFSFHGRLNVSFKFGIVPGVLLQQLFKEATAVFDRVRELNGYSVTGNVSSDGSEISGWPV